MLLNSFYPKLKPISKSNCSILLLRHNLELNSPFLHSSSNPITSLHSTHTYQSFPLIHPIPNPLYSNYESAAMLYPISQHFYISQFTNLDRNFHFTHFSIPSFPSHISLPHKSFITPSSTTLHSSYHLPYRTSTTLNIRVPSQAWRSYHTSPVSRFLSYNILLCTKSWCSLYRCLFARRESSPPLCFPCHPVITRSRSPTSTGCLRLDATTSHLTSLARCDGCRKCMPVVSC